MAQSIDGLLDTHVRALPDWPQPGVTFQDVTPLLANPAAFRAVIDAMAALGRELSDGPIDKVVGIEARGFIFGTPIALALGVGFVPARKAGKLPPPTQAVSYDLEYGSATLEVRHDALAPGDRVLVVDDVLATGGTMAAVNSLVESAGAVVAADVVLLELSSLDGRARVDGERLGTLRTL